MKDNTSIYNTGTKQLLMNSNKINNRSNKLSTKYKTKQLNIATKHNST